MSTSTKNNIADKINNKRSPDPFDRLIFEKGLRIRQIMIDKTLDAMILLLSNGQALNVAIGHFPRLKQASESDLTQWTLTGGGSGVRWERIDEDLSLKGLIRESALIAILNSLEGKSDHQEI